MYEVHEYDLKNRTFTPIAEDRVTYHYPKYTEEELLRIYNPTRIKGYYFEREYYQSNYDKQEGLVSVHGYRNILYRNSLILRNIERKATIDFFGSDICTDFKGKIRRSKW